MRRLALLFVALVVFAHTPTANAAAAGNYAGYHWKRASNPFTVKLIDSTGGTWDQGLHAAAATWSNRSTVLNVKIVAGDTSAAARKHCSYATGRAIHVCSANYGTSVGWAGLTEVSYDLNHHIVKARIRLNSAVASGLSVRTAVSCHELGHGWGLSHRSQTDTTSCMTPVVSASQTQPDQGDLDELVQIYTAHFDSLSPAGTRTTHYVIP